MKAKVIGLLVLIFFDIGFIINYSNYNTDNKTFVTCIFIITFLLFIKIIYDKKSLVKKEQILAKEEQAAIDTIRSGHIPKLTYSVLILKKSEFSSFECPAHMAISKNKLIGSTGNIGGVSVRVAKGVYLRSGSSANRKIYKTVTESFSGTFIVTNQRIVFLNTQHGFEIPYTKLTSIHSSKNSLSIQSGNKGYDIFISSSPVIEELIRKLAQE